MTVFDRIVAVLDSKGVTYGVSRHAPVFTSEEAAIVRGASLASGAKALICKAAGEFVMFVMPGDRRLDSKLVRKAFNLRSLRFATREEVEQLTTLKPGSIPPFGSLFGFVTYCDEQLAAQASINFNAGDHAISVNMTFADYVAVEAPRLGQFTA
ncbi:MAG: YbaK/EbsC family protein [Betaproteobacteria bacterium]